MLDKTYIAIRLRKIGIAVRGIGLLTVVHCTLSFFVTSSAQAETYGGIGAMDTLGDVKQRFPVATFERLKPAWAQASATGNGPHAG